MHEVEVITSVLTVQQINRRRLREVLASQFKVDQAHRGRAC